MELTLTTVSAYTTSFLILNAADYDKITTTKNQIRIWENEVNICVQKKYQLNTNIGKIFFLIMGLYIKALKANLQGLLTFQSIKYNNNAI